MLADSIIDMKATRSGNRGSAYAALKIQYPGAFRSWCAMHNRTRDPYRHNAASYVEKGIRVCDHWKLFENFVADMGERPEGMSLDRIDGNKNYEPLNCKWSTSYENQRNRWNNKLTLEKAITIASLRLSGRSERKVADAFGVVHSMIWSIMRQKAWPEALPEALRLRYHRASDI